MRWCVMNYDFNNKKLINYNIFDHSYFPKRAKEIVEEHCSGKLTMPEYYKEIDRLAMCCFAHKREYELSIGDAFETDLDKYRKVNVYDQLKPNIGLLAHYILSTLVLGYE